MVCCSLVRRVPVGPSTLCELSRWSLRCLLRAKIHSLFGSRSGEILVLFVAVYGNVYTEVLVFSLTFDTYVKYVLEKRELHHFVDKYLPFSQVECRLLLLLSLLSLVSLMACDLNMVR